MAVEALKAGDVVQLKSGGPNMTITGFQGALAVCMWFDKAGKKNSAPFPVAALEIARGPMIG